MVEYATAHLDDIDKLADHDVPYRPVRHHLGTTSFGVTAWTADTVGEVVVAPYDEGSEPAEELFLVVTDTGVLAIDGSPGQVDTPTGLGAVGAVGAALRQWAA